MIIFREDVEPKYIINSNVDKKKIDPIDDSSFNYISTRPGAFKRRLHSQLGMFRHNSINMRPMPQ